jgi:hypothetical protein
VLARYDARLNPSKEGAQCGHACTHFPFARINNPYRFIETWGISSACSKEEEEEEEEEEEGLFV